MMISIYDDEDEDEDKDEEDHMKNVIFTFHSLLGDTNFYGRYNHG